MRSPRIHSLMASSPSIITRRFRSCSSSSSSAHLRKMLSTSSSSSSSSRFLSTSSSAITSSSSSSSSSSARSGSSLQRLLLQLVAIAGGATITTVVIEQLASSTFSCSSPSSALSSFVTAHAAASSSSSSSPTANEKPPSEEKKAEDESMKKNSNPSSASFAESSSSPSPSSPSSSSSGDIRLVRPYSSAPMFAHPTRVGLTIATADSLSAIVEDRSQRQQHVLLEIYSPSCHACKRLTPIIDQIGLVAQYLNKAREKKQRKINNVSASSSSSSSSSSPPSSSSSATKPTTSFVVAVMDESNNHKPGFLTEEEERYLPIIKFFPASSAPLEGYTYTGSHSTINILRFIQEHLPEDERKAMEQDEEIRNLISRTNEETQRKLNEIYEEQLVKEIKYDPTIVLFDLAPCGKELQQLMKEMILSRYKSPVSEQEVEASQKQREKVMNTFNTCLAKSSKATFRFWSKIHALSKQQFEQSKKVLEENGIKIEDITEHDDEEEEEDEEDENEDEKAATPEKKEAQTAEKAAQPSPSTKSADDDECAAIASAV